MQIWDVQLLEQLFDARTDEAKRYSTFFTVLYSTSTAALSDDELARAGFLKLVCTIHTMKYGRWVAVIAHLIQCR